MAELDEKTQKLVDKHVSKAKKETAKSIFEALKDAKPDTDGMDKAAAKAVKDHHKVITQAAKDAVAE